MNLLFRPNPPVRPSGQKWMSNGLTLPYGPFQPAHCLEHESFECDPVLWDLWVEFHQNMRPAFSFPPLHSSSRHLMKHMADSRDRCAAFIDFGRRLTDHLHRTGTIDVPRNISTGAQWVFASKYLRDQWPSPALDGPMHERKLWVCMIYELTLFYADLAERKRNLSERETLSDVYWLVGHRVKNGLLSLISWDTPIPALPQETPFLSTSSSSDSDGSLSPGPEVTTRGYEAPPTISVVQRRPPRSQ
ncbi:hypothetical protein DFH06DRAFT_365705, partial [Mycena polygramma]